MDIVMSSKLIHSTNSMWVVVVVKVLLPYNFMTRHNTHGVSVVELNKDGYQLVTVCTHGTFIMLVH